MRFKSILAVLLSFLLGPLSFLPPARTVSAAPNSFSIWRLSTIDSAGSVGMTTSLALHPKSHYPYISYYDSTNKDLKLAFPVSSGGDCGPSNTWSCNSLKFQNSIDFGVFSSIDFLPDGTWGIMYRNNGDGTNNLRGMPKAGGTEAFYEPIDGFSTFTQVTVSSFHYDSSGVGHVAYIAMTATPVPYLRYATYVGLGGNCGGNHDWQCDTITQVSMLGLDASTSLAFVNDLPMIAYRDTLNRLAVASYYDSGGNCGAGKWRCEVIDDSVQVGGMISLFATMETAGISYYDVKTQSLRYAVLNNNGACGFGMWFHKWSCITIEPMGATNDMGTSIILKDGKPIIAYPRADSAGNTVLKIAYPYIGGNCGPSLLTVRTWQCDVVDNGGGTKSVGKYPSLAAVPGGSMYIAYYNATDGQLKLAYKPGVIFLPMINNK